MCRFEFPQPIFESLDPFVRSPHRVSRDHERQRQVAQEHQKHAGVGTAGGRVDRNQANDRDRRERSAEPRAPPT